MRYSIEKVTELRIFSSIYYRRLRNKWHDGKCGRNQERLLFIWSMKFCFSSYWEQRLSPKWAVFFAPFTLKINIWNFFVLNKFSSQTYIKYISTNKITQVHKIWTKTISLLSSSP